MLYWDFSLECEIVSKHFSPELCPSYKRFPQQILRNKPNCAKMSARVGLENVLVNLKIGEYIEKYIRKKSIKYISNTRNQKKDSAYTYLDFYFLYASFYDDCAIPV